MSDVVRLESANQALKMGFMRWQCRVRQICMREHEGKPDAALMPALTLKGEDEPFGNVITLICKTAEYSKVPELQHMVRKTNDPADRRKAALTLFSETYYQRAGEFSDVLTSTFLPDSPGAARIRKAGHCKLAFEAFSQRYELDCKVWKLSQHNPLWQATYWHNILFNPALAPNTVILGFEPDWSRSDADPMPA